MSSKPRLGEEMKENVALLFFPHHRLLDQSPEVCHHLHQPLLQHHGAVPGHAHQLAVKILELGDVVGENY